MQHYESPKLDDVLAKAYTAMHAAGEYLGLSYLKYLHSFKTHVGNLAGKQILDFGCGPRGGLAEHFPGQVTGYDPYVPEYSNDPWLRSYDIVFSADVLEHLTVRDCIAFLRRVARCRPEYVYLVAALRESAHKRLPNDINVHITCMPASWWLGLFQAHLHDDYLPVLAQDDLLAEQALFCFKRRDLFVPPPAEEPPCASSP